VRLSDAFVLLFGMGSDCSEAKLKFVKPASFCALLLLDAACLLYL
jgi:hypothetical protein